MLLESMATQGYLVDFTIVPSQQRYGLYTDAGCGLSTITNLNTNTTDVTNSQKNH